MLNIRIVGPDDWLFEEQRNHPHLYSLILRGNKERTVSIRMGISWPQPDKPGYYVLVAQLEPNSEARALKRNRFLAFQEGEAPVLNSFFEHISKVCGLKRINAICHGDEDGELSFSRLLSDYLQKEGKNFPNIPVAWKSWRCKDTNFLIQMVRNYISNRQLLFFNNSDNRTPKLVEKIQQVNDQSDMLKIPEIKALAYVMDDFDCSPWQVPPKKKKEEKGSPWAF
jgi:hypothetical protein